MINRVVLAGRLTKDPELRKTQSGKSVTNFTVAVDRPRRKDQEVAETDFISCQAWNKTAEYICRYAKKGTLIGVDGRIQTRNYDNASGQKVHVTEVVCDSVTLDRTVFCGWEKKAIQPSTAMKRIAENNGINPELINIAEFEEMAIRLGYRRTR